MAHKEFHTNQGDIAMSNTLVRKLALPVAALALSAFPFYSAATSLPDKDWPIRFIVTFTADSSFDAAAREYAQAMSEKMSNKVNVKNRPGTEGVNRVTVAKNNVTDGYNILYT